MKKSLAIDTLRFAKRLEEAGTPRSTADAMAEALNDELVDHQLTKADLAEALLPIHKQLASVDGKFNAMDARFNAMDARFNALDAKFDAKFDSLSWRLNLGFAMVFLMFSILGGLLIVRTAPPAPVSVPVERPAEAPAPPVGTGSSPAAQKEPSSQQAGPPP